MADVLVIGFGEGYALAFGRGGWARYHSEDLGAAEWWVRFREREDGRIEVAEVWLYGGELTGRALRALPLGRLEAAVNEPSGVDGIRIRIRRGAGDVEKAAAQFIKGIGGIRGVPSLSATDLFATLGPPGTRVTSRAPKPPTRAELRLRVPKDRKRPDAFYREVADLFSRLIAAGHDSPAVDIADVNRVPASTVHRWVKEARRRGLLAPARRRDQEGTER